MANGQPDEVMLALLQELEKQSAAIEKQTNTIERQARDASSSPLAGISADLQRGIEEYERMLARQKEAMSKPVGMTMWDPEEAKRNANKPKGEEIPAWDQKPVPTLSNMGADLAEKEAAREKAQAAKWEHEQAMARIEAERQAAHLKLDMAKQESAEREKAGKEREKNATRMATNQKKFDLSAADVSEGSGAMGKMAIAAAIVEGIYEGGKLAGKAITSGGMGAVASGLSSTADAATGGAQQVLAAFSGLGASIGRFVEAINPSTMLVFNQVLRDLTATIGVGLQPIIRAASVIMREFANSLMPVMEKMKPVVEAVSQTFTRLGSTMISSFAGVMTAVIPALKMFAEALDAMMPAVQSSLVIWSSLVTTIVQSLTGSSGGFGEAMKSLRSGMESLAKYTLLAVANLARFVSVEWGNRLADNMIQILGNGQDKRDTTGLAAAQNPSIGAISEFSKAVVRASLIAGPGGAGPGNGPEKWAEQTVKELQNLKAGQQTSLTALINYLESRKAELERSLANAIANGVVGAATAPLRPIFGVLDAAFGRK